MKHNRKCRVSKHENTKSLKTTLPNEMRITNVIWLHFQSRIENNEFLILLSEKDIIRNIFHSFAWLKI